MEQQQTGRSRVMASTIFFVLGTALGKLLGFLKDVLLGAHYGTSYEVDAYVVVLNVPTVIFSGMIGALAFSFIPVFSGLYKQNKEAAHRFMNNFINMVLLFFMLPLLLAELFAEQVIGFFAPDFAEGTALLAANLLRLMLPMVFFSFISDLLNAYLNSFHKFRIASYHWVVFNGVSLILFLAFVQQIGIYAMVLGMVAASIAQMILPLYGARGLSFRYRVVVDVKDPALRQMVRLSVPAFVSSIAIQVNLLVDRNLASALEEGSIAALNFAQKLYYIPLGLVAAPLLTVIYPTLVDYAHSRSFGKLKDLVRRNASLLTFFFFPVFIFMALLSVPIVKLMFEYGSFDSRSVAMTALALQFYAFGALLQPLKDLFDRTLFSMKRNLYIMLSAVIMVLVNIVCSVVLVRTMDLAGLALGTTLGSLAGVLALLLFLNREVRFGLRSLAGYGLTLLKSAGAAAGAAAAALLMLDQTGMDKLWIVAAVGVGAIVYLLLAWVLRMEEMRTAVSQVRSKLGRSG